MEESDAKFSMRLRDLVATIVHTSEQDRLWDLYVASHLAVSAEDEINIASANQPGLLELSLRDGRFVNLKEEP
jgi:hypothetical protein